MSQKGRRRVQGGGPALSFAGLFAAMGDDTRLGIVSRLSEGQALSISQLTTGSRLTRQAVTKHLRVLEGAGLVRAVRHGRESQYRLDPEPVEGMKDYLAAVSQRWNERLARLKALVEAPEKD